MKNKIIFFIFLANYLCTISCSYADSNSKLHSKVKLGVDKLISEKFSQIKNKKVGLFTNFSGRTSQGELTAEILSRQNSFQLKYLFSPEHGFFGESHAGEKIENNEVFGIPVISLYGASRRPDINILKQLDIVLIDIQDIGIRSYTFLSSVNYMLAACAEANTEVIILDRPNPIGGNIVDGNVTDPKYFSFLSLIPVSYVHGLTIGEISKMMNEEGWLKSTSGKSLKCNLSILQLEHWHRNMQWEDCGLLWFPTSPQIPTPDAVRGAAMLGIFGELSLFSIGIGTSLPFQYIGTPALKVEKIYKELELEKPNGILTQISHFKPFYGKFPNINCKGFIFKFYKSLEFRPYTSGIKTILAIRKTHPELFISELVDSARKEMFIKVTGCSELFNKIFHDGSDKEVIDAANCGLKDFLLLREKYLLYK